MTILRPLSARPLIPLCWRQTGVTLQRTWFVSLGGSVVCRFLPAPHSHFFVSLNCVFFFFSSRKDEISLRLAQQLAPTIEAVAQDPAIVDAVTASAAVQFFLSVRIFERLLGRSRCAQSESYMMLSDTVTAEQFVAASRDVASAAAAFERAPVAPTPAAHSQRQWRELLLHNVVFPLAVASICLQSLPHSVTAQLPSVSRWCRQVMSSVWRVCLRRVGVLATA